MTDSMKRVYELKAAVACEFGKREEGGKVVFI
jgi:hypothetical protein